MGISLRGTVDYRLGDIFKKHIVQAAVAGVVIANGCFPIRVAGVDAALLLQGFVDEFAEVPSEWQLGQAAAQFDNFRFGKRQAYAACRLADRSLARDVEHLEKRVCRQAAAPCRLRWRSGCGGPHPTRHE